MLISLITVTKDGKHDYRLFNNIRDAFDYVKATVGTDVAFNDYQIFNKDKTIKITVAGCDVTDLIEDDRNV